MDDIKKDLIQKLNKTLDEFVNQIKGIRTKISAALLDSITVETAHMGHVKLNHISDVSVINNKTLSISIFDKENVSCVKKALLNSKLNVNPIIEGSVVRLIFPDLTQETRKALVKLLKDKTNDAHTAMRNIRREAMDKLKIKKKNKEISEDEHKRMCNDIDKNINEFIDTVDKKSKEKETEIATI